MHIHLDEPVAAMAALTLTFVGATLGAWWQRWRDVRPPHDLREGHRRLEARFDNLEALAEATALQVERLVEGQRFTSRVLGERATPAMPSGRSSGLSGEYNTPH